MDAAEWKIIFTDAGVDSESAKVYAEKFAQEKLTMSTLEMLDRSMLTELGVTVMGDALSILKISKVAESKATSARASVQLSSAKAPQLHAEMTSQQFRKFRVDWSVFMKMTGLPDDKVLAQLYSNAEESVQTAIINTYPDFFALKTTDILDKLEKIVTQRANPMVHRIAFANISQSENESVQNYVVRLRAAAKDCDFSCPECKKDISEVYIKDQFICGVHNHMLQTDILAKAETLTNIELTIKHAEAFESALRDQGKIADTADVAAARMSAYRSQQRNSQVPKSGVDRKLSTSLFRPSSQRGGTWSNRRNSQPGTLKPAQQTSQSPCSGCGSQHAQAGSREAVCPAWGKTCHKCGVKNHFSRVCQYRAGAAYHVSGEDVPLTSDEDSAAMLSLIAHITFNQDNGTYKQGPCGVDIVEICAQITPFSPNPEPRDSVNVPDCNVTTTMRIFPDSGASICLGGMKHLQQLGLKPQHLIPCNKIVRAVGNFEFKCDGWLPVVFVVNGRSTKQALYVCERVDRIYFSKAACMDVGILSKDFPVPMPEVSTAAVVYHPSPIPDPTPDPELPDRPAKPPYPPIKENVGKLKQWLVDAFSDTAFNKEGRQGKFPTLKGPPGRVHLKEGAVPKARHSPIPVPFHMKEAVKKALDDDVRRGIIVPVPVGSATEWCSTMVVTSKKDGRPRRTVDFQALNSQCLRETHHQGSPFHLAMQVPAGAFKTVLDAVDGYHSVELDEESQPLTTFITEWGRYMYKRMPQGYLASGDAYTSRYDQIIADVPRKVKIVDDTLLWDFSVEEAFYHTFDYLSLCYQNGVVINESKFKFCEKDVQFAGLNMTTTGVAPSLTMLSAITNFPTPSNLTDARSWFGLVNQVAWAYSLGPVMQPFRELVKSNSEFNWTQTLQDAFDDSKKQIVKLVEEGVSTFDVNRVTCLAPDWSKTGMGFLLLQKYCSCPLTKAPVCCPDGWHLVFAGSRFCNDAESRYTPIEGEAAAIAWALMKCRMFIMGCPNLIVVTDHAPLQGIFGDRDLSKITNTRLFKLKEKTLQYRFTIQHCPGRWHRGSDAMSRNIAAASKAIFDVCAVHPSPEDNEMSREVEDHMAMAAMDAISDYGDDVGVISPDLIRAAGRGDEAYTMLASQVADGFPASRRLTDPAIRDFWEVRHRLSADEGLVFMDRRIVVPASLRKRVLRCLHSAHQGVLGMKSRANGSVYWPGMDAAIRNHRASCDTCNRIAPSQSREPIIMTCSPEWPFQQIALDLFYVGHQAYLACADRLTGWLMVFHPKPGQASAGNLVSICRGIFQAYGVPEEISSDGGPPFTSDRFLSFLEFWGVSHRLSSVGYAQSNGRAELAVKAAKRIVLGNTTADGSLDNDRAARAILQYRNTPVQGLGISPAQLLLHRQLRDHLPAHPTFYKPHPEWIIAANQREKLLAKRNAKMAEAYNRTAHSLPDLQVSDFVAIQDQHTKRWERSGRVVEVMPNRQYRIRVDGSGRVTLRNRRFLRKVAPSQPQVIPGAAIPSSPTGPSNGHPVACDLPAQPPAAPIPPSQPTTVLDSGSHTMSKLPRAVARLAPHNNPGLREFPRNARRQGGERRDER